MDFKTITLTKHRNDDQMILTPLSASKVNKKMGTLFFLQQLLLRPLACDCVRLRTQIQLLSVVKVEPNKK